MERERPGQRPPVTNGTPQISEDDSDDGPLHAIIREETDRQSARTIQREDPPEVQEGEDDGALGLTRTGQDG